VLAEMRKILKFFWKLIADVKHFVTFSVPSKKKYDYFPDLPDNLQIKIIRALLLIPFVLLLEAEYYLIFNSNSTYSYVPIKISSIAPKNLLNQGTIFTNSADSSEIKIDVRNDFADKNYLHLSLKQSGSVYKGITISLHDSIPLDANLIIKCRTSEQQTNFRVGLIDNLSNETSKETEDYFQSAVIPGKNWADLVIPLKLSTRIRNEAGGVYNRRYIQNTLIRKVTITFDPDVNTAVDISDIKFEWKLNKLPEIILLVIIWGVGIMLFFRTSLRKQNFPAGLDFTSAPIAARTVFLILALSASISTLENKFPAYNHELYLIYILFMLLICFDEFYTGRFLEKPAWPFRYSFLIIALWLFRITDNAFILSPLTLAAFIPVIQQRKRMTLLFYSAGLLVTFLIIDKFRYFIPEAAGALIIIGVSIVAAVLKEIISYEVLKTETDYTKYLYEKLFENSYDGIYTTDEKGIIKTANYWFAKMLRYPAEEMIGKNIFDFVIKEDIPLLERIMKEAVAKDFNMCDINFIDANNSIRTSLIRLVAIYKNNLFAGYQSIAIDITERKRYEQELSRSQERYKTILNAIPDIVLQFTREGILLDYHSQTNPDFLFNENYLGKSISNIFEPHISQYFIIHAEKALKNNHPQIFEYENNLNGDILYKEARIVPSRDGNLIAIIRDITERRHAELRIQQYLVELDDNRVTLEKNAKELAELNYKLEEINKSKDKFFSIVAHDLRSPFTGLLGFSDILSTQLESLTADEIKTYSGHLNHSLKNVFKLLENLLDWSRMQTGKIKFDPETFHLESLIQRIVGIFQINASEKKIVIEICVVPHLTVFADEDMTDIIIRNLVSNAIKFTRPGGNIYIQALKKGNVAEITIKDNGIGILPENLARLFKFDENISTEGTARERGTGLGLVLCKEFIEKNNGHIEVDSKLNVGSEFKFTLPAAK
jgi:PAS domain S-box-containing protein